MLTTSSKGKGFSSHPVKQLLCSPLPELLYLQESLEAVGVNRLVLSSSGILQTLPWRRVKPWLLYWPVSSQRSEQGKPWCLDTTDSTEQEPSCAAFSSRWANILKSHPFPYSWEVRSSDYLKDYLGQILPVSLKRKHRPEVPSGKHSLKQKHVQCSFTAAFLRWSSPTGPSLVADAGETGWQGDII